MRKRYKIINIALIFILRVELMPLDTGAVCLKVPMGITGGQG